MKSNGLSQTEAILLTVFVIMIGVIAWPYLSSLATGSIYGEIPITSSPVGATVTMEGRVLGITPFGYFAATDMQGKVLTFTKTGYLDKTYTMFMNSPVGVTLTPKADTGTSLLISSYPSGVYVYDIYRNLLGVTPFSLGMPYASTKVVYFEKPGYTCPEKATAVYNGGTMSFICTANYYATPVPTVPTPVHTNPVYTYNQPSPTPTPIVHYTYNQPPTPTYTTQPGYTTQPTYPGYTAQPTLPPTLPPGGADTNTSFIEDNMVYIAIALVLGIIVIALWPTEKKRGRK